MAPQTSPFGLANYRHLRLVKSTSGDDYLRTRTPRPGQGFDLRFPLTRHNSLIGSSEHVTLLRTSDLAI